MPKFTFDDPVFKNRNPSPEVISVPIHFFSSVRSQTPSPLRKVSAALRIQKLFRGFLVRICVKRISAIRNEVCKVERSMNSTEVVELFCLDAKERLRVNETLMSLLFTLDSIRGVDFGVREFRKAVIRKAIALQEKVDSIVSDRNESVELGSVIVCESEITAVQVIDLESSSCTDHVIDADRRGVDFGVCEFRKAVIKKATALQEKVDSVMNADCVTVIDSTMEVEKENDVKCDYTVEITETLGEGTDDKNRNIRFLKKRDLIVPYKNQSAETDSEIDADNSMILAADTDSVMTADCETVTVIDAKMEVEKEIDVNCDYTVEITETRGEGMDDKNRNIRFLQKVDSVVVDKNQSAEISSEIASEIEITSERILELESSSCRDHVIDTDNSMNLAADAGSVMTADCATEAIIDSTMEVEKEINESCDYAMENTETSGKGSDVKKENMRFMENVDSIVLVHDKNQSAETVSEIACESEITYERVLESSSCPDHAIDADNSMNLAADTDPVITAACATETITDSTMEVEKEINVSCDYAMENTETSGEGSDEKKDIMRFLEKVDSIVPDKNRCANAVSEIACESEITSEHVLELESSSCRDQVIDADISMNLAVDTDPAITAACATETIIDATMEVEKEIDVNCDYAVENTETSGKGTNEKKRNVRFLEKLVDDNEKMMKVMTQMFEMNEMQTRMMNSLSERVERLEKTFVCDKHRKKKKKKMKHSA